MTLQLPCWHQKISYLGIIELRAFYYLNSLKIFGSLTMQIYLYAEADDLEEIANPLSDALSRWIKKTNLTVQLINDRHEPALESNESNEAFWNIGINLTAERRSDLRKSLDFLYKLATEQRCEFVVGLASTEAVPAKDICYFGYEEGRPDVHEIAHYLGFKL